LIEPRAPYERIVVELRNAILDGRFAASEPLPTIKQLADTYQVATGTAHRALSLLTDWGLIDVSRGQRATVRVSVSGEDSHNRNNMAHNHECVADQHQDDSKNATKTAPQLWEITLRGPDGRRYPRRHVCADINQPDSFRGHLLSIARIETPTETDDGDSWVSDYELEIAQPGGYEPKLVLRW
jgi:integrase